jgi:flagellar protein FlaE
MNPRAYDPDDLRRLAGVATEGQTPAQATPSADDRFRATHLRALFETARALPPEAHERPYIPRLPATPAGDALLADWLDFLVRRVGRDGAADALDYYRRLRWLSDDAASDVRVHLAGVPDRDRSDQLTAGDHKLSLLYVARLAAIDARD